MKSGTAIPPLRQAVMLGVFLVVCLGSGAVGSVVTAPQIPTWYASLNKPPWNPPSWVFGPVWSTLYVMMSVALWLAWKKVGTVQERGFLWFWIQLFLNASWSFLFFGWQQPGWAFAEILLLWVSIAATVWMFRRYSSLAALLLVPYLGWVTFAAYLNFTIWRLNR